MCIRDRAGVTPYTSSCEFAECYVFSKQSQPPGHCGPQMLRKYIHHTQGRTFSRSYGAILPSSFTRVLSSALVFSTYPPVLVWGTDTFNLKLRGFSWKHGIDYFAQKRARHHVSGKAFPDLPRNTPYSLKPDNQQPASLAFSVPPSQLKVVQEY